VGRRVSRFVAEVAQIAAVNDQSPVAGRTVERVEAHGKWLAIHFSGDLVLLTHMLMSGSWHIYRQGEKWLRARRDMRMVIETERYCCVAFAVPIAEFHTAQSLARHRCMQIGPDVLADSFDQDDAARRIAAQADREIAVVLLDQQVLAGIGNVYKSEICFAARVHPFRKASSLTRAELAAIADFGRRYMLANVRNDSSEKIVTDTGERRTTGSNDAKQRLWVYGRTGEPCRRCGAGILMRKQSTEARTTFWCPECQPML